MRKRYFVFRSSFQRSKKKRFPIDDVKLSMESSTACCNMRNAACSNSFHSVFFWRHMVGVSATFHMCFMIGFRLGRSQTGFILAAPDVYGFQFAQHWSFEAVASTPLLYLRMELFPPCMYESRLSCNIHGKA